MGRKCPVCDSESYTPVKQIHMMLPEGVPLPERYTIVVCNQCGFCFADTPASQADYDVYYSLYNNYSGQGENKAFEKTFSPIGSFLEKHLDKSAAILDIGFGKGALLERLRGLGYEHLCGLDPSQHSVDSLNEHGLRAYRKSVYDATGELGECFDLVFLTSVLEHLLEPKAAIVNALGYLKEEGYLIVDVPDYALCDKVDIPIPNQFNQEHINYFSEMSFMEMLQGTQCRLLKSKPLELRDEGNQTCEYSRMFFLQKYNSNALSSRALTRNKDDITEAAIQRYFSKQEAKEGKTISLLSELYESQKPLVVWGTGAMTMHLLASTELSRCNIAALVDGNPLKTGTCINGRTVAAPDCIRKYPEAVIAISAMKFADEIKKTIAEMAVPNPVVILT